MMCESTTADEMRHCDGGSVSDDSTVGGTRRSQRCWLARTGYRRTERECPKEVCDGALWYDSHELVCRDCAYVIDMAERRRRNRSMVTSTDTPWEDFWAERPEYFENDTVKKCVGGFLDAYDWMTSDETDGLVSDVDPTSFYR